MFYTFFNRLIQFFIKIAYYFIKYKEPTVFNAEGAIKEIPNILNIENKHHPLIVISDSLFATGITTNLENILKESNVQYTFFYKVKSNPTCQNVQDGYETYIDNKCDCLIAFGGGSPIDAAKVIGAKVSNPKKEIQKFQGLFKVKHRLPLLIAIPTTAGTGSEATIAAVITDEKTNHKASCTDPKFMPKYAILDPTLLIGLPPFYTSTTGMDALCHAIEAYTNHIYCTKKELELAKKAIKLIHDNLYKSYLYGDNIEARKNMLLASHYAGLAFTRGSVGYVHAIGHTLSGLYHLGHGLVMAILLPKVFKEYGSKAYKRLAEIADYLKLGGENKEEKALKVLDWINSLNGKMDIPNKVKELKIEDIPQIVSWAIKEGNPLYPCPKVFKRKDFYKIVRSLL